MENERLPGFEDVYAYIDSQFLDSPAKEKPPVAQGPRTLPPRAKPPEKPPTLPPAQARSERARKPEPGPVPAERPDKAEPAPPTKDRTASPKQPPESAPGKPQAKEARTEPAQPPKPSRRKPPPGPAGMFQMRIPELEDYLPGLRRDAPKKKVAPTTTAVVEMEVPPAKPKAEPEKPKPARRLKRPELSKPRPRKKGETQALLELGSLPSVLRNLKAQGAARTGSSGGTLGKIANPELTLEETANLLGVCPATVRRYTNKGWLRHHRTKGNQRRFFLADIAEFVEEFARKKRE
jgi:excisionase family DNA binding protein